MKEQEEFNFGEEQGEKCSCGCCDSSCGSEIDEEITAGDLAIFLILQNRLAGVPKGASSEDKLTALYNITPEELEAVQGHADDPDPNP